MDPDPALFGIDLQEDNKKIFVNLFLKVHLHHFSKKKSHKEVKKQKVFLTFFA